MPAGPADRRQNPGKLFSPQARSLSDLASQTVKQVTKSWEAEVEKTKLDPRQYDFPGV